MGAASRPRQPPVNGPSSPHGQTQKKTRLKWYSTFGLIEVGDHAWTCPQAGYLRPLPAQLEITARACSRPLQRALVDFGSDQSFAKAINKVREHYGFELNPSAVRKATLHWAGEAAEQVRSQAREPYNALDAQSHPTIVAQADGSFLPIVAPGPRDQSRPREYEEIRLAAAQAQGRTQIIYAASFESVTDLGPRWGHCARDVGRGVQSIIHGLGDGAEWIPSLLNRTFGEQACYLCDFHHVKDYLREAAPSCRPQRPDQWRRTQQRRLKAGSVAKVIAELAVHMESEEMAEEDAPVRRAHRYLSRRQDQLEYAQALSGELPIGSGLIESGHKHVLQARLKLPGCAWLRENAANMAQLRVLRANRRWEQLWN